MEADERATIAERWLERIDTTVKEGFARMDAKLDQKADKSDVLLISSQVVDLAGRVRDLEDKRLEAETWHKALTAHESNQIQKGAVNRDGLKTNIALIGMILTAIGAIGQFIYTFR